MLVFHFLLLLVDWFFVCLGCLFVFPSLWEVVVTFPFRLPLRSNILQSLFTGLFSVILTDISTSGTKEQIFKEIPKFGIQKDFHICLCSLQSPCCHLQKSLYFSTSSHDQNNSLTTTSTFNIWGLLQDAATYVLSTSRMLRTF